jgi:RimJ/RimL family protein N-acetyltransferase
MILLDKSQYYKVSEPLGYIVTINKLFARSVVEKHVTGAIYVDRSDEPGTFYVVHPYGMSLLFGDTEHDDFNLQLVNYILNTSKVRSKAEWLQAFPGSWNNKLTVLLGVNLISSKGHPTNNLNIKVEENTRVNFKFNLDKYRKFKQDNITGAFEVLRTDARMFENMQGSVVPMYFWENANAFLKNGVGFSIIREGKPVSTAYSAYMHDNQLELGIETLESYRGKGLALYTCSALIDYCLKNNYEPVWSCRLENIGSYKLSQKLGFEPTVTLPYYRLPV